MAITRLDWVAIGCAIAAFIGVGFILPHKARAHDHYTHWLQPGTAASCCNEKRTENGEVTGDCYPTVAELRKGAWWARRDTGQWIEIPDSRVLRELNPDETGQAAHLCESNGSVYCFVPPSGGS